jgi:hypothetical protein
VLRPEPREGWVITVLYAAARVLASLGSLPVPKPSRTEHVRSNLTNLGMVISEEGRKGRRGPGRGRNWKRASGDGTPCRRGPGRGDHPPPPDPRWHSLLTDRAPLITIMGHRQKYLIMEHHRSQILGHFWRRARRRRDRRVGEPGAARGARQRRGWSKAAPRWSR